MFSSFLVSNDKIDAKFIKLDNDNLKNIVIDNKSEYLIKCSLYNDKSDEFLNEKFIPYTKYILFKFLKDKNSSIGAIEIKNLVKSKISTNNNYTSIYTAINKNNVKIHPIVQLNKDNSAQELKELIYYLHLNLLKIYQEANNLNSFNKEKALINKIKIYYKIKDD